VAKYDAGVGNEPRRPTQDTFDYWYEHDLEIR
jgi:hypothetical protein